MIEPNLFGQSRSPRTNLVHSQTQEVGWTARSLKGDGHIPSEIRAGRVGEAVSARGDGGVGGAVGVHSVPGPPGGLSLGSADPRFESPGRCCSASDCKYQTLPV